jgi:tRNA dimethylallyltransferase
MNYLLTIVGPTAIGKTSMSIALAKHFKCEILSCDSRQFYQEMEIGTAVPTKMELESAKHHFIQNKSIHELYTVGDFEKEAIAKLDQLFLQNKIQIMVGGSGLYVNAVLDGFDNFLPISEAVRENVRLDYEKKGIEFLQNEFKKLDANYYQYLQENNAQTLKNPQRLMRFLEVCISTNMPYSSFLNKEKKIRNFTPIIIGLEANREQIYARINQRVDDMLEQGLLEEVVKLQSYKALNAMQTVGYKEFYDYLENKIPWSQAIDEVKKNTRNFAKRQLTWFKKNKETTWFHYNTDYNEIIHFIEKKIQQDSR